MRNAIGTGPEHPGPAGSGLDGMRERLAAVGGSLAAAAYEDVYVATARIPLS